MNREVSQWMEKVKKEFQEKEIKNIFEAHQKREEINRKFPELVKSNSRGKEPETLKSFIQKFPPGSPVFISSLNRDGIVQGEPNPKGEIPVLSGFMRLFIHWNLLESPQKRSNPPKKKHKAQLNPTNQKDQIDLRGLKPPEAIEKLEVSLDKAQLNNLDRLKIIHGRGVLKKTVFNHLSRSVYVSRWQSFPPEEGVTLAYLGGKEQSHSFK